MEAEPLSNIKDIDGNKFVWKNIVTRFGASILIFLLGLKACRLRFASFGIRALVLKSIFYSFIFCFLLSSYLVPFVFFIPCSYFVMCTRLKSYTKLTTTTTKKWKKKKKRFQKRKRKQKYIKIYIYIYILFVVSIHSNQNIIFFCPLPLI